MEDCEIILNDYKFQNVYIINHSFDSKLKMLGKCLANSRSPEVVAISLSDSSVLELSSVYTLPRQFTRSSVAEVIKRRGNRKTPDLNGSIITAATMNSPPFTIFDGVNKSDEYDGVEVQMFKEMSRQMNFTLLYLFYGFWGMMLDDGTWFGGIGQAMQEGDADLAIGNLWVMSRFYDVMDLGPTLNKNKLAFLVRRPEQINFQWFELIDIFQTEVWLATLISFMVVVIGHHSVLYNIPNSSDDRWWGTALTIFGHFVMATTHSRQGRTFFILTSWSVFSMLLTSCLSSGIFSRLSLPLYSPRVDTLQQMVEQNYYWSSQIYALISKVQLKQSFLNPENAVMEQFQKSYKFLTREEIAVRAGYDNKISFPVMKYEDDIITLYTLGLAGSSALKLFRVAKESYSATHVSFGVKKNSPLLKPLTLLTLKFLEAGLPKHWLDEVISRWPEYNTRHLMLEQDIPVFREPQPLKLRKLQPVFYILLFGLGIASLVFLLELSL
ncbi:hypothetical protein J6590_015317 [Homalodisca vitripennis]|nr:hypothetical protein J6590_015317 [Homalodisca vitripennis]